MPPRTLMAWTLASTVLLASSPPASAQSGGTGPAAAAEFLAGYTGFGDEGLVDHTIVGGAARVYLSPRIAIGPELVYMMGPGEDRDLFLTGNLTFDLVAPRAGRSRRVVPFLVAGGGLMRHTNRFGSASSSSTEGAITGGGGVRVRLTDHVYAMADVRLGWEPHIRLNGGIGWEISRQ